MLFPSGYGREVHLGAVASGCVTWYSSTILGVSVEAQKVQPESHMGVLLQVVAPLLLVQLPTNASGEAVSDASWPWAPVAHM